MKNKGNFYALVKRAEAAGKAAGEAVRPVPLGHVTVSCGGNTSHFYEPHGACGFAWVVVKPNRGAFAKYLKEHAGFSKHYYGGLSNWVGEFGQEVDRKAAYARAYAGVLKEVPGYDVYSESRLD